MNLAVPRLATVSGDDNMIKIWEIVAEKASEITSVKAINKEGNFLTDVAWSRCLGSPDDVLASSSEQEGVSIWKIEFQPDQRSMLKRIEEIEKNTAVWRVNWSETGLLALNCQEDEVKVYKEDCSGNWKLVQPHI